MAPGENEFDTPDLENASLSHGLLPCLDDIKALTALWKSPEGIHSGIQLTCQATSTVSL